MLQDRRGVARDEGLAIAEAHDQRHVHARADQPIGLASVHDRQRVGAVEAPQGGAHRVGKVAGVGILDEVCDRLRVGFGAEKVTFGLQHVAKRPEVLDDAVVDHRDLAGAVTVRMRIEIVRAAVGGPAGVGEADAGVGRPVAERVGQVR